MNDKKSYRLSLKNKSKNLRFLRFVRFYDYKTTIKTGLVVEKSECGGKITIKSSDEKTIQNYRDYTFLKSC